MEYVVRWSIRVLGFITPLLLCAAMIGILRWIGLITLDLYTGTFYALIGWFTSMGFDALRTEARRLTERDQVFNPAGAFPAWVYYVLWMAMIVGAVGVSWLVAHLFYEFDLMAAALWTIVGFHVLFGARLHIQNCTNA